jgi:hypothetical protein
MKNRKQIEVDYYQGDFGSSIRIGVSSEDGLIMLKDIFQKLSDGSADEFKLHEVTFVHLTGLKEMNLRVVPKLPGSMKTVHIVQPKGDNPVAYWSTSSEGWEECVGLIEGIFVEKIPSHQYLSIEKIDDALIILSYLEGEKKSVEVGE